MIESDKQQLLALVKAARAELVAREELEHEPIAIIGFGARLPGAHNVQEFWNNLSDGKCSTSRRPEKGGAGGFLDESYAFDPAFFNISPREAEYMDPQQRLLLEVAYEALECAGYADRRRLPKKTSVTVGISGSDYSTMTLSNPGVAPSPYSITGSSMNAAAGRLSFVFGIQGPSIALDTACSSSLVAVHVASRSLRSRESDFAIVGGVNVILQKYASAALAQTNVLSPSGVCRTFDATADGMVRGEGCGVILLKRLRDALRDGDLIRALIRGTHVNQDGASSGLTAPNGHAQEEVIRGALLDARIGTDDVDYIEAHGTGTRLGDPIELRAIAAAYAGRDRPLWVGAVKANLGHLEAASGITGIIKGVLSLEHQLLPQQVNFAEPNPEGPWDEFPFEVLRQNRPWPASSRRRRMGVSSFGFSGTNAHVILEEAPATPRVRAGEGTWAVLLSAKTELARSQLAQAYMRKLDEGGGGEDIGDVAYTSAVGREHHEWRFGIVARSKSELRTKLSSIGAGSAIDGAFAGSSVPRSPRVAFLFSGQGSQYKGMGQALYQTEPLFRHFLDEAAVGFVAETGESLFDLCWGKRAELLDRTRFTQPTLFCLQYALGKFWMALGLRPIVLIGHSIGEYAAACLSGILDLPSATRLVCARGALMDALPEGGGMAAVVAPRAKIQQLLRDYPLVTIAAHNAPEQVVISGDAIQVAALTRALSLAGVLATPLKVSHAFHSELMQPAYQPFLRAAANNHHYGKASLRMISTLGSDYPEAKHFLTAEYWAQQLVSPVDFVKAFGKAECIGIDACLEIGPGATATGLGQRCAKEPTRIAWLASLNERSPEVHQQTLARLYATGAKLDWQAFFAGKERRVVALPTYPFQRQIYRAPLASDAPATPQPQHHAARCTVRRWVAYPVPPPATLARARSLCVVLGGDEATRRAVLEASSSLHAKVLTTAAELSNETEFEQLTVVYIASGHAAEASDVALALQTGAKALLEAIQQTLELRGERQRTFVLITRGAQCVDNDDRDEGRAVEAARGLPEAPLWQLVAGLRREYPGIRARCVDLPDPSTELSHLASALSPGALPDLALRDGRFYCQTLHEDVRQAGPLDAATFANGAQLVTGASGDIGRMLIDWLARHGARRILALSRSGMLGTAVEALMAAHPGLSLSTLPVDVADHASLERAVGQLAAEGQPLTGIFHLAGAIDDDMLERQTPQRLANVLASKATGAWNLHRVSKELPIEHFVAFSSASTFLGAAGQSSYLVANEFLNQLALHRRREGLPALSVAWGPWEGTQAIAAPLIQQNLELAGLRAVSAEAAFSVLGSLLSGPTSCVGCFDVDWARFMSGLSPEERSQPYFAAFAGLPGATGQLPSPVDVPRTRTPRDVAATVYTSISKVLHVPEQSLRKSDTSFVELGMDSITAVELRGLLNRELGVSLPVGFAYSYKTAREVIRFLESPSTAGAARTRTAQGSSAHAAQGEGVALVGMSCNLPGAIKSPDELWRFLVAGRDGIERIDRPIWLAELRDVPEVPDEVRFAGLIRDYADFDPDFFHISPREARYIDPQQRLILAAAWEALEAGNHAGAPIDRDRAAIYVGMGSNEFAQLLARHSESIGPHFGTGNAPSILAGRIAYFLDWHGPAVTIDTACSSSLVAILHACESIQRGDCDIALAGGINLQLLPVTSLFLAKNGALSKKGRCQPFSAGADGYVRAEGCAMVLLKSLRQALDDGDHIHAIVRGGHINQDGRTQGITAPNGRAQVQVLSGALRKAGVEPNQVTYVEAHGTGTPLGDPIEMESIHQVYGLNRSADQPLYVGSVKANVGHTESAAGAVSFIKVALMLEHARIPAQLHLAGLNPNMNLANADGRAAIIVPAESLPWDASTGRRIGAVSSFGFSGTNVHLLLEEPERPEQRAPALTQHDLVASTRHTFVLSARSDASLTALKQRYGAFLAQGRADSIADICYTASCFRPHHPRRVALDCVDVDDLVRQLAAPEAAAPKAEIEHQPNPPQLVFTLSADEAELSPFMNALSSLVPLRAASERAAREVLGLRLDALASEREPLEPDVSRRPSPILLLQLVLLRFLEDTLGEQVVVVDDSRVRPSLDQAIDSPADSRALLRDVASRLREHAPRLNFVASGVPPQHSILLGFAGTGARPPAEQTVDCSDAAALNALFGRLYALGVDVDWRRLHDGQNRRKVKLPTYAFDLQTYLPEAFRQAEAAASWLARPTQTGADLIEFQLDFDGRQPYPLAEHVLHDEVVVPGAFYLSLVCEVARVHFRRDSFTLSDVTFPEAQILENGQGYQARLSLRSADGRSYDIEALVRRAGASAWQRRASLRLDLSPLEGALPAFAPTEGNTSEARLDAESFYATLARHGSRLGGSFQCIRTIRTAAASAQCELRHEGKTDFGIAPGLFDAFLQTMGLCLPGAETDWDEVRVPYSIGRVHVGIPQIAACKTITRLERQLDVAGSQRLLVHDVLVYDLVDRPVLWLEDFATLTYRAHDSRRRPSREAEQHIYRWSWQPLRPAPAPREVYAGNAIVYCPERFNGGAASRNLRAQLTSAGAVALGELTECFRALDQAAASGGNPLDLWLIYGGAEAHVDAALIDLLAAELIALRDAISTQRRPASWTIHIVSQRCFHTGDGDEVTSVLPRIVLGFFKTLGVEHGEPRWVWHDLDDVRPDSVREHLRRPRPGGDERIVAYRRGQALVPRLGRHHLQAHIDPLPMTGTHVITGATGGVARELAKALYGAGARHFVLISRSIGQSGPDDGWSFDSSVTVKRIAVDVTHTDVLGDILDDVEREMPPIRMVFHTAAVLRDGAMAHQTARDFSDVLGAKALGAWHLHQALEARPNVRLVLFSSVGAVFGAVGQGIYAGANQFLHGLAALRTSCGLLTTCVASGGWEGTGMQKGQSGVAHKAGIANLPSSTIIDGLLGCIADGLSDGAIMNVDWDRLAAVANARGEHHAELSLFLRRERGAQTEGSMLERLMNVPKSARASYITQNLSREIAAIMEIDGDARMSGRSLRELGLDSMTALQIRQLVNQRFELNAPATLLFEVNSVRELANYVCAELDQRTRRAASDPEPAPARHDESLEAKSASDLASILSDLVDVPA